MNISRLSESHKDKQTSCKKLIILTLLLLFSCPFGLKQAAANEILKANYYEAISTLLETFRPKPVQKMHEWFITPFTLNPIIFAKKADLAYEATGLEGNILTHYIEKELKLRINPRIPIKVGDIFAGLNDKESVEDKDYLISSISGEILDLLIISKKSETWGMLKVKYIFAEHRINSSYNSRETKQIQIIPSDNSTDKTPEAILVHKSLTRDDMEKLLQNAAKEIVNRVVLILPSAQESTK